MVIKSKIYDFLKKNLGEYLYGFEKNQLDVGLLSGHIDLVNVNFRPDKVNELLGSHGLPIHIKAGLIGKLRFKCHYSSFLSSPMEVELDELLLVFGPISHIYKEKTRLQDNDEEALLWQIEKEQEILDYAKGRKNPSQIIDNSSSECEIPHRKRKKKEDEEQEIEKDKSKEHKIKRSRRKGQESNDENAKRIDEEEVKRNNRHRSKRKGSENVDDKKAEYSDIAEDGKSRRRSNRSQMKASERGKDSEIQPSDFQAGRFAYESSNQSRNNTKENQDSSFQEIEEKGFIEKYFTKVLKNLTLTVKTVHVSYEDETYPYENPLSLGFSLEKLEVKNINFEWFLQGNKFSKRQPRKNSTVKEIIITNAAVYIYSMASVVIPTSLWEGTFDSEIGIFDAFPAYEVRDLILQQSKMLSKSHPSTFIEPTQAKICVTFNDEIPNLKAVGLIENVSCKFTPAMAECMRNFFDYCTNVKIWPLVMRYRPYERIPERLEKREHRKERRKRRELVKLWFQYAFAFIRTKRAAIKYVQERKKERELIKSLEAQEKIREKIMMRKIKEPVQEKPSSPAVVEIQKQSSLFSFNKQRKVPGSSGIRLDEIVKDYNNKKPLPLAPVKQSRRPYDGEEYFPKTLNNSELEFCLGNFSLNIIDEETGITMSFSISDLAGNITTLLDEMSGVLSLSEFVLTISDQTKSTEAIRCSGKKTDKGILENAFKTKFVYRPGEIFIPNDIYTTLNKYETNIEVANFTMTYTHNILNHFFLIKEALNLDKAFRENMNQKFVKETIKGLKKKKIPKVFGVELKQLALCKKIACDLVEYQKKIEEKIVDINSTITTMLFSFEVNVESGKIHFHDFSPSAMMSLMVPNIKIAAGKNKEQAFLSALGIDIKTGSTPAALYDFVTTLANMMCEKLKQISTLTSFKRVS